MPSLGFVADACKIQSDETSKDSRHPCSLAWLFRGGKLDWVSAFSVPLWHLVCSDLPKASGPFTFVHFLLEQTLSEHGFYVRIVTSTEDTNIKVAEGPEPIMGHWVCSVDGADRREVRNLGSYVGPMWEGWGYWWERRGRSCVQKHRDAQILSGNCQKRRQGKGESSQPWVVIPGLEFCFHPTRASMWFWTSYWALLNVAWNAQIIIVDCRVFVRVSHDGTLCVGNWQLPQWVQSLRAKCEQSVQKTRLQGRGQSFLWLSFCCSGRVTRDSQAQKRQVTMCILAKFIWKQHGEQFLEAGLSGDSS